jgi:rfaE bifunctional protein kinase chain/domain
MHDEGLEVSGMEQSSSRKTTVKTRVIGNKQQLLRVDDELISPLTEDESARIIQNVSRHISTVDAVIFEDYNKGVLTPKVIEAVVQLAHDHDVITTVDPKKENFFAFKKVTMFKPNLKELSEGLNLVHDLVPGEESFEKAIALMQDRLNNSISFVTLSERGVFIQDDNEKHYVPAHIRNISDVSGAGDTVISVATAGLAAGLPLKEVAEWANLAGGLVCEKSGVVPVDKDQLREEIAKLKQK